MDADWLERTLGDVKTGVMERSSMTPEMMEIDDRLSAAKARFGEAVRSLPKDPETPVPTGLVYLLVTSAVEMNWLQSSYLALLHNEQLRRFKESYTLLINQVVPLVNTHHNLLKQIIPPP